MSKFPESGHLESGLALSEKSKNVQAMFDRIAPRYDLLNRLLSARQDVRWRKALVKALPHASDGRGRLADVACGTGDVGLQVGRSRADYCTVLGFDISASMIHMGEQRPALKKLLARRNATARNPRVRAFAVDFTQASAEQLPLENDSVDALSIAFGLRNVDNRTQALREFCRVIRPGGRLLVLEFFESESTFFAKIFDLYFKRILPRIGGLLSDKAAYAYLPHSVSSMPAPSDFTQMLKDAGFRQVRERRWLAGATRLFVADKPL